MSIEKVSNTLSTYDMLAGEVSRSKASENNVKKTLRVAMPAQIISINYEEMTCECQPLIRERIKDQSNNIRSIDYPILLDVPIVFSGSSYFQITYPLAVGDEGIVIFADRCIDAWWQNGGIQNQFEERFHDLSDGIFIPAMMSQPKKHTMVDQTNMAIRSKTSSRRVLIDGVNIFTFKADYDATKVNFETRISTLESEVATLKTEIATLKQTITSMKSTYNSHTHSVTVGDVTTSTDGPSGRMT